jgi:hypothetical protein
VSVATGRAGEQYRPKFLGERVGRRETIRWLLRPLPGGTMHRAAVQVWPENYIVGPKRHRMSGHLQQMILLAVLASNGCSPAAEIEFRRAPLKDLGETRRFVGHDEPVCCLAVSNNGKRLLSGCGRPGTVNGRPIPVTDRSIRLWDLETGRQLLKIDGHTDTVESVCFSPDGKMAVSGSDDGTIRFWDLETGKETKCIKDHGSTVFRVGFFSDGDRIYSAGVDGTVRIWNVHTSMQLRNFGPQVRMIEAVALSRDETRLFAGGDFAKVWCWNVADGTLLHAYEARGRIQALAAAPSADQLLVCTSHGSIKLLEIATGTTVREFDGHVAYEVSCSRFTADGKRFASCGGDRTLRIWDVSTGKQVGRVEGFPDGLTSIIITPDDKHVLAAGGGRYPDSLDYTIRMWSIEDIARRNHRSG